MSTWTIGITHAEDRLPRLFPVDRLRALQAHTEVRVLGSNDFAAIRDRLGDVDCLLGSWGMPRLDAELLAAAPRLRAVCYAAGTVKGFVTDEAYDRGVTITTAMHANAVPVAECTVALITLANKNWFRASELIRREGPDGWDKRRTPHVGNYGTAVGLVGFGAVGQLVAERLAPMDLAVHAYDPHVDDAVFSDHGVGRFHDLLDLARTAHVVSVHAPNVPATRGMLGAGFFAAMRDGATFVNTARGAIVDEAALIAELRTGRIDAHLDVTFPEPPEAGHPFYELPNCWLTPHRAGSTEGEVRRLGAFAIDDCLRLAAGEEPRYPVTREMLATMA